MDKDIKTWNDFFKIVKEKEYSKKLNMFLDKEYASKTVYPPRHLIFNAFQLTPLSKVRVVIVGQDPYHEQGQAMGLSFSVPKGIMLPPSLKNIYKEISMEFNTTMDYSNGDLTYLSKQGVFLLNAILSVQAHMPLSHNIDEYFYFLKDTLEILDRQPRPIVFMLWGGSAKKLKKYLHNPSHLILEANHPSPLSANRGGWFGCNHFKMTNQYLSENGLPIINWINTKQNI